MGSFGSYFKGEKRKLKKEILEKKLLKAQKIEVAPRVVILGKKKKQNS